MATKHFEEHRAFFDSPCALIVENCGSRLLRTRIEEVYIRFPLFAEGRRVLCNLDFVLVQQNHQLLVAKEVHGSLCIK